MNRISIFPVARFAAALALAVLGGNSALAAEKPVELRCHFEAVHHQAAPRLTLTNANSAEVDYGRVIAAQLSSRELSCNIVDKPLVTNAAGATPVVNEQPVSFAVR
jgi:hypothetical protein